MKKQVKLVLWILALTTLLSTTGAAEGPNKPPTCPPGVNCTP